MVLQFYYDHFGMVAETHPHRSVLLQTMDLQGNTRYNGSFICPLSGTCFFSAGGGPQPGYDALMVGGFFWHVDVLCAIKSALYHAYETLNANGVPSPHLGENNPICLGKGNSPINYTIFGRERNNMSKSNSRTWSEAFSVTSGSGSGSNSKNKRLRTEEYNGKGGHAFFEKLTGKGWS
jgi:hypothetical protein